MDQGGRVPRQDPQWQYYFLSESPPFPDPLIHQLCPLFDPIEKMPPGMVETGWELASILSCSATLLFDLGQLLSSLCTSVYQPEKAGLVLKVTEDLGL